MITEETFKEIKDRILGEYFDTVVEVSEAYPASLLFHAHSENNTYTGKLTSTGRLSKLPIYEEEI